MAETGCCGSFLRVFQSTRPKGEKNSPAEGLVTTNNTEACVTATQSGATHPSQDHPGGENEDKQLLAGWDLWQAACDKLNRDNPDLVTQYDTLLVRIVQVADPMKPPLEEAKIRSCQVKPSEEDLRRAVEQGQRRIREFDAAVEATGEVVKVILSFKELISSALTPLPQVAAVWTGVLLVFQFFSNAPKQSVANREGIQYVTSLVNWYCELLGTSVADDMKEPRSLYSQLRANFTDLYCKIIEYQMRSVLLYYCNWFFRIVRGTFNYDAWDAALDDIKTDEQVLYQRLQPYHESFTARHLKAIRDDINTLISHLDQSRVWKISKAIGHFNLEGLNYEKFMEANPDAEEGTCEWVLELDEVKSWNTGLLLLTAVPGQGKSVLARFLVKHWGEQATVCHFFFKNDSRIQMSASKALCALLHQLLAQQPHVASIEAVYKSLLALGTGGLTSVSGLWETLKIVIKCINSPVILVLDALDECGDDTQSDRKGLLTFLQSFCQADMGQAKAFVTTQTIPQITGKIKDFPGKVTIVNLNEWQTEIQAGINKVIDKRVDQFPGWDKALQTGVKGILKTDPKQHTYIWLRLIFNELDSYKEHTFSDEDWLKFIRSAGSIDDTYTRLLANVHPVVVEDVKRLFTLVLAAGEPLTVAEVNTALSMAKGRDPDAVYMRDVEGMAKWINDNTGFMLTVSKGDGNSVRFIHQTAKLFITKPEASKEMSENMVPHGEEAALSASPFRQFITAKDANICLRSICGDWLEHKTRKWKVEKEERGKGSSDIASRLCCKDLEPDTVLEQGLMDYAMRLYAFHFDMNLAAGDCRITNGYLSYPFGTTAEGNPLATIYSGPVTELLPAVHSQHFAWYQLEQMAEEERGDVRVPEVYCVILQGPMLFAIAEYICGKMEEDEFSHSESASKRAAAALNTCMSFKIPKGTPLGRMRDKDEAQYGVIEHPIFIDGTSTTTDRKFDSVSDLEDFVNKILDLKPSRKVQFGQSRFVFLQITNDTFQYTHGGLVYIVDFRDATILPPSFMDYGLVHRSWGTTNISEISGWKMRMIIRNELTKVYSGGNFGNFDSVNLLGRFSQRLKERRAVEEDNMMQKRTQVQSDSQEGQHWLQRPGDRRGRRRIRSDIRASQERVQDC